MKQPVMPRNFWQRMIFAFITVIITVSLFVFYNLFFVNDYTWDELIINGVYVLGGQWQLWQVFLIEFVCAYTLEMFVGSPLSMKIAFKIVNPKDTKFFFVETMIICATVLIMCPAMSLIATIIYSDLSTFNVFTFLATWLKTIMHNFPLAFFSQLFFIQPFVRFVFSKLAKLWTKNEEQNQQVNK